QRDPDAVKAQVEAAQRVNQAADTLLDPRQRMDLDLELDRATSRPERPGPRPGRAPRPEAPRPREQPKWSEPQPAWGWGWPPPGFSADTDPALFAQWWHEAAARAPAFVREWRRRPAD